MESQSSDTPRKYGAHVLSVVISMAGLLIGVATHFTIVIFHDTGLLLSLLLVSIGLLVGEIVALQYQAWGGALMLPVAIAPGTVPVRRRVTGRASAHTSTCCVH